MLRSGALFIGEQQDESDSAFIKKCIFSAINELIFWSIEIFFVSLQAIWCERTAIIVSIALIIN